MTSLQGLCWLHLMKRSWGFSFFLLRPVCVCFDYCCVHFVVDLNILDISFHCILQFLLPGSGGYRGGITPKIITHTERYSACPRTRHGFWVDSSGSFVGRSNSN